MRRRPAVLHEAVYDHLHEYGTCSLFGALGEAGPRLFAGERGPEVRPGVRVGWTFDERINDGFSCAASLAIAQRIVEDPAAHLKPAAMVAAATPTAAR